MAAVVETERAPALAEFIAATARSVVPLFLGAALLEAGLLAAAPARSSTFLRNGLGRFSTSFMSYCGVGAFPSAVAAATAEEDGTIEEGAVAEDVTADVDAALCILVRADPDEDDGADSATVTERRAADADEARMDGRRSLVGRTAGCVVPVELDADAVDCVGVCSPSEEDEVLLLCARELELRR